MNPHPIVRVLARKPRIAPLLGVSYGGTKKYQECVQNTCSYKGNDSLRNPHLMVCVLARKPKLSLSLVVLYGGTKVFIGCVFVKLVFT